MNELKAERTKRAFRTAAYWVWSLTWGGVMTWLGALIALALLVTGHKPKRLGPNVYFETGTGWGGMEYGAFFFVAKDALTSTRLHEAGHGIQNLILGPFMPFVVCIPSAVRYWMRRSSSTGGKKAFSGVLTGLMALFGAVFVVLSALGGAAGADIALLVVGIFLIVYVGALALWLFAFEIPKYKNGAYVPYDSIWFEGSATRLGEKHYSAHT